VDCPLAGAGPPVCVPEACTLEECVEVTVALEGATIEPGPSSGESIIKHGVRPYYGGTKDREDDAHHPQVVIGWRSKFPRIAPSGVCRD
jgi:hypothetical protein